MMEYWQERQEAMYKAGEMKVNQYFTRLEKAFNQDLYEEYHKVIKKEQQLIQEIKQNL